MKGTYRMLPGLGKHRFRQADGTVRILTSGDEVTCHPEELRGVLHRFEVLVDPDEPRTPTVGLRVVQRSAGWYDVVNEATGRRLNSRALREAEARELASDGTVEDEQPEPVGEDDVDDGVQETFDLTARGGA